MNKQIKNAESKKIILENGKIFFSKATERKFFFYMTIIMLVMDVFVKWI